MWLVLVKYYVLIELVVSVIIVIRRPWLGFKQFDCLFLINFTQSDLRFESKQVVSECLQDAISERMT